MAQVPDNRPHRQRRNFHEHGCKDNAIGQSPLRLANHVNNLNLVPLRKVCLAQSPEVSHGLSRIRRVTRDVKPELEMGGSFHSSSIKPAAYLIAPQFLYSISCEMQAREYWGKFSISQRPRGSLTLNTTSLIILNSSQTADSDEGGRGTGEICFTLILSSQLFTFA